MHRIIVWLLALLCVTCAGVPHAFTVSQDFSRDEHRWIEESAADWNAVSGEPITLDGGPWQLRREQPSGGMAGRTTSPGYIVQVQPGLDEMAFRFVIMHEFGHVVGLHHLHNPDDVMHPGGGARVLSRCDLVECTRVGACVRQFDFTAEECPRMP